MQPHSHITNCSCGCGIPPVGPFCTAKRTMTVSQLKEALFEGAMCGIEYRRQASGMICSVLFRDDPRKLARAQLKSSLI